MKIKQLITLFAGVLMLGLASCEYDTIVPEKVVLPDEPVSFSKDVEPTFTAVSCMGCHSASFKPDLSVGKAYASITSMNLVVAGNPDNSKLWQYIQLPHNSASKMTTTQKELIKKWITEGAKNN